MSGRLRVVVATTDGPSTIRRITAEDPQLRSVVCLDGTATALPISAAYDAFVRRPTGVVERDVGHPAFRVDVDRPIDAGASWQLGLYIAHRLKAAGRLAEDSQAADGIVWASGIVDADLNVGPVERVAEKARRSAALFASDLPVLLVCPRDNAGDLPDRGDRLAVGCVAEVLAPLGLAELPAGPAQETRRRSALSRAMVAGSVVAAVVLAGIGAWALRGPAVAPPSDLPPDPRPGPARSDSAVFDPASVLLEVLEGHRRDGACLMGPPRDPDGTAPVCAVSFRATNTGDRPAHMWLYGSLRGAVRDYASRRRNAEFAAGVLAPGESGSVRVEPPDWVRRGVLVRGLLVLSGGPEPQVAQVTQALAGIDLMSEEDLDVTAAGLRAIGVEVREFFHSVPAAR